MSFTYRLTISDGLLSQVNRNIIIQTKSKLQVYDFDIRSADHSFELNTYPYMNLLYDVTNGCGCNSVRVVGSNQNPASDYFAWCETH
jgi:hypothetical protein